MQIRMQSIWIIFWAIFSGIINWLIHRWNFLIYNNAGRQNKEKMSSNTWKNGQTMSENE